jgi:hypothetical protein
MWIGAFSQDAFFAHSHIYKDFLTGKTARAIIARNVSGTPPTGDSYFFALQSAVYAEYGSYANIAVSEPRDLSANFNIMRTGNEIKPASISAYVCIKY